MKTGTGLDAPQSYRTGSARTRPAAGGGIREKPAKQRAATFTPAHKATYRKETEMRFSWKRWRLPLVAAATAVAMSVALAGPAFASEPGESSSWTPEQAGGGNVYTPNTNNISEARNGSYLMDVWRGDDNDHVWMSVNNGPPFTLQNPDGTYTETYTSPTVVPYGQNLFMILHVGVDSNIYYTFYDPSSGNWSDFWYSVPGQYSPVNMPVSVTQMGAGSTDLFMVYHSSNNDVVWGTHYGAGSWEPAQQVAGGESPWAPSVTYNPASGLLFTMVRGEDNAVYMSDSQWAAGSLFSSWRQMTQAGATYDTPHLAALDSGTMVGNYLDTDDHQQYALFDQGGNLYSWWGPDNTWWQSTVAAVLVAAGTAIYALLTGEDQMVYWKRVYGS